MNVKLISHTPDPEKVIATAAKLCYSSSTIDELQDGLDEEKTKKFIEMLMDLGHESPIEHVSFTFGIEGISRSCTHQLVRHRIASYSQKSQRYVNETQFEYVTPSVIENLPAAKELFDQLMTRIQCDYQDLRELIKEDLMNKGMDEKAAGKVANEDARFVLPNACTTSIIVTMNIRSLFNFFKHRCCNRAQWEIREVAWEMWKQCVAIAPTIFKHAGPDCVTKDKCPEGKMSCGKQLKMKSKYDFKYYAEMSCCKPPIICYGERSHPVPDKEM